MDESLIRERAMPERPRFCDLPEWLAMTPAERDKYVKLHWQKMREYGEACAALLYGAPPQSVDKPPLGERA